MAGAARADRTGQHQPRLTEHQLSDAGRGHGGSRAGHSGRVPGGQRADLHPPNRCPVVQGSTSDLGSILDTWLATHADGIACVIDANGSEDDTLKGTSRVRSLTPEHSKGLEFDLVILINPEAFGKGTVGTGIEGSVDRYVAMTRATQQLVILTSA